MYNPRTNIEAKLFPNLDTARVTGGPYIPYIGREGTIVADYEPGRMSGQRVVRIAFPEFWDRSHHKSAEEAEDSGYFFDGEFEIILD